MIAIIVDFEIDRVSLDDFLTIMHENASVSLANEVSCHQFNIMQELQNPIKIFPYELFDDAIAFELHNQADH